MCYLRNHIVITGGVYADALAVKNEQGLRLNGASGLWNILITVIYFARSTRIFGKFLPVSTASYTMITVVVVVVLVGATVTFTKNLRANYSS